MADTVKGDLWKALKHPRARPWLTVAATMPASVGTHALWGSSPAAGVGLTLAAGLLTASAWWAGDGTTKARRLHATLSTAAGTSYMVVATVTDPLDPFLASTWAIGGAVAAGGWNIRQALRANPDAKTGEQAAGETGLLVKSLGKAKLALRGEPKVEPNKVTAPYKITDPGALTSAEIGRRIENIAGELGISANAIRNVMNTENAAEGEFVFVPKDMLAGGVPYPGPSSPGGCITEPIVNGIYEDGEPERFWYPADETTRRNATHFGVFGMNGSAKSTGTVYALIEVLTRYNAIVWGGDPAKGMQTFGPLLPYMDWVEITQAGCEAMVDALPHVITARADELGRHGFKNWTPEAFRKLGMPYMVVVLEESAKLFRNGSELEPVVEAARSAGISVEVSQQRPSATSMPTDVREQLGGVRCYGVKGATTADMALPDDVRDAGARPEAWENRKPGYHYLVAPGVDEERYSMKARHWDPITDDEIRQVLERYAVHTPAGTTTTVAAGEAYANRAIYTPGQSLTSINPKETVMSKQDAEREEEIRLERQVERDIVAAVGDDDGTPEPAVDPDAEIPPVAKPWKFPNQLPVQGDDRSPEEALAELLAMLAELRAEGRETVGPKDFAPYGKGTRIGRARSWISGKLTALADEGVYLEETDEVGVYKLLDPELTPV
ncbi:MULTISPECIES: plasmid transfer protein TraB [Streptomyces]|uniref:Conjugal transfer protein TraB n=2 Tax=Streptomyces rimosus subsp. rimosus TaxID=132474 RepID=L8EY34_STRR1|nr:MULTISPECIES: plasmid transfer protein TraB [Streptomyces]KOG70531.1 TraB protein [Kitasatospora aureofaciens]MYT47309.1 conjugal transfer protein TraB [Streptomyces sp. SID5471]KEF04640.1 TraB protein [Streptomyces rimosus]KEF19940.1 TraB protein [Streptomyces rimosus]KUJ29429.1 conjugal transfer protein TraB [Streptomyces rimosus subsp. rimosus]